jgi:hypothetical protein
VVLEVVGCWAESLANQQRIARDSDQGLKSESRERAPHPKGTANQTERKREQEVNSENEQGEKKKKKKRKKGPVKGKRKITSLRLRGVGCNLGSAGDSFLGNISDGLVALSKIGLHRLSFPTKSIGDVVDG